MKTMEMLINEIKESEELKKCLADAVKDHALAAFLKEQGVEATVEEFVDAAKAQAESLGDDALDAVAGGANIEEAIISIFTVGIGCAIEAYNSAHYHSEEEWPDGRILCTPS